LRALLHGAAPIAPAVKHEAIRRFGPVLLEYWGATEGGVYTLVDSATWLARPGTVGQPLPSFEVYAVRGDEPPGDSEDARQGRVMSAPAQAGQRLPAGERGTLVCRHRLTDTPFVYHQDDAKTRAAYPSPGVFTVGDLGHVDADGFVYLSDRRSNLILSGGVNIYPAEVERVLAAHPDVTDVAVAGVPDAEWGERVVAVVEPRAGVAPDALERALRALCEAQLARFKHPVAYRLVPQLPRLPSGKVRRTDLAPLLLPATLGS
jgi:long-chain acyl-CoA synthetase